MRTHNNPDCHGTYDSARSVLSQMLALLLLRSMTGQIPEMESLLTKRFKASLHVDCMLGPLDANGRVNVERRTVPSISGVTIGLN